LNIKETGVGGAGRGERGLSIGQQEKERIWRKRKKRSHASRSENFCCGEGVTPQEARKAVSPIPKQSARACREGRNNEAGCHGITLH